MENGLQPALPRHHYVEPSSWNFERRTVLASSWMCVGRLSQLGLTAADRLAVVEVLGESILITTGPQDEPLPEAESAPEAGIAPEAGPGPRLRAHVNLCRHRGAQVIAHEAGDPPAPRAAR